MKGTCIEEVERWGPKSRWAFYPCPVLQEERSAISVGISAGRFAMGKMGQGRKVIRVSFIVFSWLINSISRLEMGICIFPRDG